MNAILTHFRIRLHATLKNPRTAIMLAVYGWVGAVLWPGPSQASGEGWFLVEGGMANWMIPSILIMWTPCIGLVSGRLTGPRPMPTLPIGVRGRAVTEAIVFLVPVMLIRIPSVLYLGHRLDSAALSSQSAGYGTVLTGAVSDTISGALLILPLLLLGGLESAPARNNWDDFKRWVLCAVLIVLALKLGLLTTPLNCILVGASISCLLLFTADLRLSLQKSKKQRRVRSLASYRISRNPEAQLRRDQWLQPLIRNSLLIVLTVALQVIAVLLTRWLVLPKYALAICTFISVLLLLFGVVLRPIGNAGSLTRFICPRETGCRGGDFAAWWVLPVRREAVLRGVYLHVLITGVAVWALVIATYCASGWLATGQLSLIDQGSEPIGWALWSAIAIVPCLAGLVTAGAVGDDALIWCSAGLMVAFLPLVLVLFMGHADGPLTLTYLLTIASIGGLPPLVHLRKPVAPLENAEPEGAAG